MIPDGGRGKARRVVEAMGSSIVRGLYDPVVILTETEASLQCGVSRTVIREAVKALISKGLIQSRPRIGIRVQPFDNWNLLDGDVVSWILQTPNVPLLFDHLDGLRRAIEPTAAGFASQRASISAMVKIDVALSNLSFAQGTGRHAKALLAFHNSVVEAAGNSMFQRLTQTMAGGLEHVSAKIADSGCVDIHRYAAVVEGIRARNEVLAEIQMRKLLSDEARVLFGSSPTIAESDLVR